MEYYETSNTINATPEQIWEVLTDARGMTDWDSGVEIEGTIAPGQKLKLHIEANPGRAFSLKVVEFDPGRRMVWKGGMPLGLFTGERTYTLTPAGDATAFHMREEYSGPMLGMIWKSMPDLQPSFDRFASGLKSRVETGGSA